MSSNSWIEGHHPLCSSLGFDHWIFLSNRVQLSVYGPIFLFILSLSFSLCRPPSSILRCGTFLLCLDSSKSTWTYLKMSALVSISLTSVCFEKPPNTFWDQVGKVHMPMVWLCPRRCTQALSCHFSIYCILQPQVTSLTFWSLPISKLGTK